MARLLVVSRSMALAMRLADVHEVVEYPVEAIGELRAGPDIDAVVLDVGEPTTAIHALDQLRSGDAATPVLIVSGYQPAWAGLVTVDVPEVLILPLPITRAALLDGVATLTRLHARQPVPVEHPEPRQQDLDQSAPSDAADVSWDEPVRDDGEIPRADEPRRDTVDIQASPVPVPVPEPVAEHRPVAEPAEEPVEAAEQDDAEVPDLFAPAAPSLMQPLTPPPLEPPPLEPVSLEPPPLEPPPLEPVSLEPPPLEPVSLEPPPLEPVSLEPPRLEAPSPQLPFTEDGSPEPDPGSEEDDAPAGAHEYPVNGAHDDAQDSGHDGGVVPTPRRRDDVPTPVTRLQTRLHNGASAAPRDPEDDLVPDPDLPWEALIRPSQPLPPRSLLDDHPVARHSRSSVDASAALPPWYEAAPETADAAGSQNGAETPAAGADDAPPADGPAPAGAVDTADVEDHNALDTDADDTADTQDPATPADSAPPWARQAGPQPPDPGPQDAHPTAPRDPHDLRPVATTGDFDLEDDLEDEASPSQEGRSEPEKAVVPPPLPAPSAPAGMPPPLPESPPAAAPPLLGPPVEPMAQTPTEMADPAADDAGPEAPDGTADPQQPAWPPQATDTRSLILPFPTSGARLGAPTTTWADQDFDWWNVGPPEPTEPAEPTQVEGVEEDIPGEAHEHGPDDGDQAAGGAGDITEARTAESPGGPDIHAATDDAEPVDGFDTDHTDPAEYPHVPDPLDEPDHADDQDGVHVGDGTDESDDTPQRPGVAADEDPTAYEPAHPLGTGADDPDATEPQDRHHIPEHLQPAAAALRRRRAQLGLPEEPDTPSELERRLSGLPFRTSLGPGGTSAELVALTLQEEPGDAQPAQAPSTPAERPYPMQQPPPLPTTTGTTATGTTTTGTTASGARMTATHAVARPIVEDSPVVPEAPADGEPLLALVESLSVRSGELHGVAETAQMLAAEIVEIADADAAAVLVPDGGLWRVSGGVGLRPPERRLVLDGGHWLVAEIAVGGRALLVEDTDIVRPKLAGAPLAAWRHLLAVPIPDVRSAVVLARGHETGAFTEQDLAALVGPVRGSVAPMRTALACRQLARLLTPLREVDQVH